jgi:hypothetical protein
MKADGIIGRSAEMIVVQLTQVENYLTLLIFIAYIAAHLWTMSTYYMNNSNKTEICNCKFSVQEVELSS